MAILMGLLCQSAVKAATPGTNKHLTVGNKFLVSAQIKNTVSAAEIKQAYSGLSFLIKNGFSAYRITYNTTDAKGKPVVASGAIFVPDIATAMPLLNYNHGTIFPSRELMAPSYLNPGNSELGIAKLFASAGYFVIVPDYVGYGTTKETMHPYGAYELIAGSVIDMLYAAKEFSANKNITLSGKCFFSGWSEGAAVSLAVVKKLEAQHDITFIPASTVVNAGPYYSSGFVDHILNADKPLTYMSTYVWVLRSYNRIYNINKPDTYYFNEPAASDLQHDSEAYISHDPKMLFTDSFKLNYKAGKDVALKNALLQNDLWNWKPSSPIVFCHGDRDEYVPLFNSEKAFSAMKEKGAAVTLHVFKGQTHTSSVFNFLQQVYTEFESRK